MLVGRCSNEAKYPAPSPYAVHSVMPVPWAVHRRRRRRVTGHMRPSCAAARASRCLRGRIGRGAAADPPPRPPLAWAAGLPARSAATERVRSRRLRRRWNSLEVGVGVENSILVPAPPPKARLGGGYSILPLPTQLTPTHPLVFSWPADSKSRYLDSFLPISSGVTRCVKSILVPRAHTKMRRIQISTILIDALKYADST